tara:strand:- start:273 stop:503 length:231 start_codon:yes stop_codon:yes gene_type:complete
MKTREQKADKFKELCEKRVSKATHYLVSLGNLANRAHYEYTQEQVNEMERHLKATLNEMLLKYKSQIKEQDFKFSK